MVPVALAYAGLAGVPPEVGLTTAFAAMAAYALFGTSRHLKVTVSSTMAIMSASVVADLAGGDPTAFVTLTAGLALTAGVILVAGGLLRLGFISDFLAKSVVTGFIFGLAITIIIGQMPKMLGVPGLSGPLPQQVAQLVSRVPETDPLTLAVGTTALVTILVLRRISRRIPGPLITLILGIVLTSALGLTDDLSVVGDVATGLPSLAIPDVPLSAIPYLILGAAGIVFLAVEIGRRRTRLCRPARVRPRHRPGAAGARRRQRVERPVRGFVADASLSQTATAEASGAKTQLASVVTAALVLATAVFLAPLFQNLPNAVLGAIVIAAVLSLMDVAELRRYWRWRRTDLLIALVAMVGVLLTTVLVGMLLAVLLSILFVLYQASRPRIVSIGRMPGVRAGYGDLSRHPDAEVFDGLLIVRLDAPLYYFNANVAKAQIIALVNACEPPPEEVLLDIAATADLDVTTSDMLFELVRELRGRSVDVSLAQVKGTVRDRLRRTGLMSEIGADHIYLSVGSGVTDFEARRPSRPAIGG